MLKTNRTLNTVFRRLILGAGGLLFLSGCVEQIREAADETDNLVFEAALIEPVSRDLSEIQQTGVLRMITGYSSGTYFLYKGIQVGFEYELLKQRSEERRVGKS